MKTKPTQQAIRLLRESAGIDPDFILCRAPVALDEIRKKKIETYAHINSNCVISEPDIDTIYRVPLDLEKENMGQKILEKLSLTPKKIPDWSKWESMVNKISAPSRKIKIAIVGKYIGSGKFSLKDSYVSVIQALTHAGVHNDVGIEIEWVDTERLENSSEIEFLSGVKGIIVPGGFGGSGVEGKIKAIKYARENNIPFLGLCYGMQLALIEFARNVCNLEGAGSTEINKEAVHKIIDILPIQKELMGNSDYGGTMRLGAYPAILKEESVVEKLYRSAGKLERDKFGNPLVLERHRHRYEVSPRYLERLSAEGILFSGYHLREDGTKLVEFIELPNKRFFVATQAHPEFKSRLTSPAPLFVGFVNACLTN